nr:hypothetical protein [Tanacetum cinerariifolium]
MRTRSSSNLPVESHPNPTTSNPKRHNRRRSKQSFILEESLVDMMADKHTMAELLRAPTEGYEEAIVVPPILAGQFELKHGLINMMTLDQFFGLEKDNPHDHIRAARRWLEKQPPHSILTWEGKLTMRYLGVPLVTRILSTNKGFSFQMSKSYGISLKMRPHIRHIVSNGKQTSVWHDIWVGNEPLSNQIGRRYSLFPLREFRFGTQLTIFDGEVSENRSSSTLTRNQTSIQQKVENSNLEEHLPHVITMADNCTMAELLRAPTEGYAEAIVVPPILAEQFELKHSLINMMTTDQFFGLRKDDPHDHIRWGSPPVARKRTPAFYYQSGRSSFKIHQ